MRLNVSGGFTNEEEGSGNPYSGGVEYSSAGVAQVGFDLVFSEGLFDRAPAGVPEHGQTLTLLAMSIFLLLAFSLRAGPSTLTRF